jgi:hypothetical protein
MIAFWYGRRRFEVVEGLASALSVRERESIACKQALTQ